MVKQSMLNGLTGLAACGSCGCCTPEWEGCSADAPPLHQGAVKNHRWFRFYCPTCVKCLQCGQCNAIVLLTTIVDIFFLHLVIKSQCSSQRWSVVRHVRLNQRQWHHPVVVLWTAGDEWLVPLPPSTPHHRNSSHQQDHPRWVTSGWNLWTEEIAFNFSPFPSSTSPPTPPMSPLGHPLYAHGSSLSLMLGCRGQTHRL